MQQVEERLKTLMVQSLAGDERAYRSLLDDVARQLRGYYGRRLRERAAIDDLVQETLIAVHSRRATYDSGRPFTAWLHAIARYKLIDYLRSNKLRETVTLDDAPEAQLASPVTESELAHQDLDTVLEEVSPLQKSLIKAVKVEGRSIAEVASASGLSQSAVKVTVHRALKKLSQRFGRGQTHD